MLWLLWNVLSLLESKMKNTCTFLNWAFLWKKNPAECFPWSHSYNHLHKDYTSLSDNKDREQCETVITGLPIRGFGSLFSQHRSTSTLIYSLSVTLLQLKRKSCSTTTRIKCRLVWVRIKKTSQQRFSHYPRSARLTLLLQRRSESALTLIIQAETQSFSRRQRVIYQPHLQDIDWDRSKC